MLTPNGDTVTDLQQVLQMFSRNKEQGSSVFFVATALAVATIHKTTGVDVDSVEYKKGMNGLMNYVQSNTFDIHVENILSGKGAEAHSETAAFNVSRQRLGIVQHACQEMALFHGKSGIDVSSAAYKAGLEMTIQASLNAFNRTQQSRFDQTAEVANDDGPQISPC